MAHSRIARLLLTATLGAALSMDSLAQAPVADSPAVRRALDLLRSDNSSTVADQVAVCEIPAPPFGETARGKAVSRLFEEAGLTRVRTDQVGNVIGELPGTDSSRRVALSAHLDTVFPEGTDVTVKREGGRLRGPGIGDDCRGLAVIVAVARALTAARVTTQATIVFVATVGEEGAGNLRGVRHLFDARSAGTIDAFISVDGTGIGLTSRAVGSHRYRVVMEGPGGHSFGAFGMPNPIHALGRAIARVADFVVPESPKTTFNVGVIAGGTSVNSIAMTASADVDLRSEDQAALDAVDSMLRRAVSEAVAQERQRWPQSTRALAARIEEIGRRPAGSQPDTAPIVLAGLRTAAALGLRPPIAASSTDANYPMSLGIPAVTIDGGGTGGDAHSDSEWYEDGASGWLGPQWALLYILEIANRK